LLKIQEGGRPLGEATSGRGVQERGGVGGEKEKRVGRTRVKKKKTKQEALYIANPLWGRD